LLSGSFLRGVLFWPCCLPYMLLSCRCSASSPNLVWSVDMSILNKIFGSKKTAKKAVKPAAKKAVKAKVAKPVAKKAAKPAAKPAPKAAAKKAKKA
jgi:hypothetical protein